ncbi:hypothetical protein [Flavobacterium reichenbachii]|uniref:Uncharacterized protein n=1 Tax=Flavobacterium reichenbachii TaxID=362418 RepID=A0A085ZKR6_9FLAO|nr:hypothetical protein [Flavobacterium reichenbachii]KFF05030.1 hypothetical protein IW19_05585 [Flavobacterium reichenbachii]OXB16297.1 hypothetical protein B0A68_08565 [Flavobacterium reichenbachii]
MIVKREKRKRIFYVPGMISLVLIPLIFIIYFYRTNAFEVYGKIELSMPPVDENYFEKFKVTTLRNYKEFDFNERGFQKTELSEMKLYLRKLIVEKDTINGIKIHFGPKSFYQTFITSLDILSEEDAPTWIVNENDIYVLGSSNTYKEVKDTTEYRKMDCGTAELMEQRAYWEKKNRKEEETRIFKASFFKQKWILISFGYFGLVLLNIFVLVKFNRSK